MLGPDPTNVPSVGCWGERMTQQHTSIYARRDCETYHIFPKAHRDFNLPVYLLALDNGNPDTMPAFCLLQPYLVSCAVLRVDPLSQLCLLQDTDLDIALL